MQYSILSGLYGGMIGFTLSLAVVLGHLVNNQLPLAWSSVLQVEKGLLALGFIFPVVTGVLTARLDYYRRLQSSTLRKIKHLEQNMQQKQMMLEAVTSLSPIIVSIIDPSFKLRYVSEALYGLTGIRPEAAKGKPCYEIFGQGIICRNCPVTKAFVSGKTERCQVDYSRHDGCLLFHEQLAVPVIENGAVKYVIEVIMDLSERAEVIRNREEDLIAVIDTLVSLIELKDKYTGGHSQRVRRWAVSLARQMGLSEKDLSDIDIAACLHDIGKIGIPEQVLNKPCDLSREEYGMIMKHSIIGESAIGSIGRFRQAAKYVRHHHERFDGGGYPDGLSGADIPLGSRIINVADSFDAMISNRAYRHGYTTEQAIYELRSNAGKQFDPIVVDSFINILNKEYKADRELTFSRR